MSDALDTLVVLGILLVMVWIGFLIMAVQWVADNALEVAGAVVLLIGVTVVWAEYRRHTHG